MTTSEAGSPPQNFAGIAPARSPTWLMLVLVQVVLPV
jgi:hypothetical protein